MALPPSDPDSVAAALRSPPARHAAVGLASSLPFLGAFAAFSTLERMQRAGSASPEVVLAGCRAGLLRWAPFGAGAALYYTLEAEMRPRVSALLPFLPAFALPPAAAAVAAGGAIDAPPRPAAAPTQYELLFGRPSGADAASAAVPESIASRVLAGAASAAGVCGVLYLRGSRSFRSVGSVLGTAAGCAVAAAFMPSYDDVERRSLL